MPGNAGTSVDYPFFSAREWSVLRRFRTRRSSECALTRGFLRLRPMSAPVLLSTFPVSAGTSAAPQFPYQRVVSGSQIPHKTPETPWLGPSIGLLVNSIVGISATSPLSGKHIRRQYKPLQQRYHQHRRYQHQSGCRRPVSEQDHKEKYQRNADLAPFPDFQNPGVLLVRIAAQDIPDGLRTRLSDLGG